MPKGIIGRKIGMTQIFAEDGNCIAVTVIKAGPCTVIRKKTPESKDGYASIVLGFEDVRSAVVDGEKLFKMNKPELGVFKAAELEPKKIIREIRLWDADLEKYEKGQVLDASLFTEGEKVDVVGTSKGHGTAGVMKRHNFGGSKRSHGVHEFFRHGGSIGTTATPGRVIKGMKMPGRYGNTRVTVENLTVFRIMKDEGLLLIKGNVPGANGSLVIVHDAAKARRRPRPVKQK